MAVRCGGAPHATSAVSGPFVPGLTLLRWRGQKRPWPTERPKAGWYLACGNLALALQHGPSSSHARGMLVLSMREDGLLVVLSLEPDGKENPHPDIGQSTHCNRMTLAFGSFALVILLRPGFRACALPGKLLQDVAQGFDAAQPSMGFLIGPALEEDGRGSGKRLQARGIVVARPVVADFSQQPRSETFARPWQGLEELAVLMHQKKAFDLLVGCCHWIWWIIRSAPANTFRAGLLLIRLYR
jgi:hypothetical protein